MEEKLEELLILLPVTMHCLNNGLAQYYLFSFVLLAYVLPLKIFDYSFARLFGER